mmetsp:Transcript_20188/g.48075  ORF Transcript_20188/g.48075 Transcript_20188/m.48075 type:complete len:337 (+) Transcript_20188:268-1278(+)
MVERLFDLYKAWDASESPRLVVLKGAGEKAFCAGGDVRQVVDDINSGNSAEGSRFFGKEYRLNFLLSQLSKPHVAFMDGVTMGGGAGVSIHGAFRVATERTLFAMPELAIGLFPDIGSSYFLSRLPGQLGLYLALTGTRLRGAEVRDAGLATHLVRSERLPEVEEALVGLGEDAGDPARVDGLLKRFELGERSDVLGRLGDVNDVFGRETLVEVLGALQARAEADEWAREALAAIRRGSPFSAHVAFEELRRGSRMRLSECLEMEYALAKRFTEGYGDFAEGVRALLIDKDNNAKWRHPRIEDVPPEEVRAVFEPLGPGEQLGLREREGVPLRSAM